MKSKQFLDKCASEHVCKYPDAYAAGVTLGICEYTEEWLEELCGYADLCPHGHNPSTCPELIHECNYLIAEIKSSVKRIIHH